MPKVKNYKKNDEVINDVEKVENNELEITAKIAKENELLKAQLSDMMDIINQLKQNQQFVQPIIQQTEEKEIPIVSLCFGQLNLSTEPNGGGDVYTFTSFGQIQNIPLSDVKKIVRSNQGFAREGYFYIDDESVVKSERLSKSYENILNAEEMNNLIGSTDIDEFAKKFMALSEGQKRNIVNLIIDRIVNQEEVNLNVAMKCGELYSNFAKCNGLSENYILMMAEQNKNLLRR